MKNKKKIGEALILTEDKTAKEKGDIWSTIIYGQSDRGHTPEEGDEIDHPALGDWLERKEIFIEAKE